jgi:hypothetical protein
MGHIEKVKTDEGYHLTAYAITGEVAVLRRDDLRGCWEVTGEVFGSREEAFSYAEGLLTQQDHDPETGTVVLPDTTEPATVGKV